MSPFRPVDEQLAILMRGVEFGDVTTRVNMEAELRQRLAESAREDRPLRIYCGSDPTASDLHLGHTVPMRKLAQFQELGHEVIFLIGSFTALIGDPSDQTSARRQQTDEEVREHAKTFTDQAWKVLDSQRVGHVQRRLALEAQLQGRNRAGVQLHLAAVPRPRELRYGSKGNPIWLHDFSTR